MDRWYPAAIQRPGPAWKTGYPSLGRFSLKRGSVWHSAEGNSLDVMHNLLDGPLHKSWQFTIGKTPSDGTEQHYPIDVNCWHAGDVDNDGAIRANIDLDGLEFMGVVGEPLTPYQLEQGVQITRFCASAFGFATYSRYPVQRLNWTLVEHNQVSDFPTACPSDRIPWGVVLDMLEVPEEEDHMLELVTTVGASGLYTFITDWRGYNYVTSSLFIAHMQDMGHWPAGAPSLLSDGERMTLKALDRGQDIG